MMAIRAFFQCFLAFCATGLVFASQDEKDLIAQLETNGDMSESDINISSTFRNAMPYESLKWPAGVVPYKIEGFDGNIKAIIVSAMEEITRLTQIGATQCITFKEHAGESDYLLIKHGTRCNSNLGKTGGEQITNLADKCAERKGIVMHELMHSLGFLHEQNRPDRDEYVTIFFENIKPGRPEWNFRPTPAEDITTLGLPYDYDSILHYGEKYFTINDKPTILPIQSGVTIGQRDHLSTIDIQKMRRHYGCRAPIDFRCNFDVDWCGITQVSYLIGEWDRSNAHRADDPTKYNSGPDGDHTSGKGYYAVIRGSEWKFANMRLEIVEVPVSDLGYCVRFWYQMVGIGDTVNSNGMVVINSEADGQHFTMEQRDQLDGWHNYILHFKPLAATMISLSGLTTNSDLRKNDIAIDDIWIKEAPNCDV